MVNFFEPHRPMGARPISHFWRPQPPDTSMCCKRTFFALKGCACAVNAFVLKAAASSHVVSFSSFFTPLALRAFGNKWLRLLRAVCFTAVCHSSTVLWTDGNSKHGLPRGNITHCPHIFMIHGGTPAWRGMLPLFRCTICTISLLTKWPM